jgi:uncharacterized protein involved in exopolysaccharide biosynthesis
VSEQRVTEEGTVLGLGEVADFLIRHLRTLALAGIVGGAVLGAATFFGGVTYTSRALIVPDVRNASAGRLAGLAAQFGVAVPGGGGSMPPALFVDMLRSPALLRAVATMSYPSLDGATLLDHLGVSGATTAERAERATLILRQKQIAGANAETSAIQVGFRAATPELATELVERSLAALDSITLVARSRHAATESQFFATRLAEANDSLRAASARLSDFLTRNRMIEGSPALQFQRDQLQLNVSAARDLHQSIQQSFESARLESARAVPTFIVLERPAVPAIRDGRGTILKAVFGGLFGVALAAAWLIASGWWREYRAARPGLALDLRSILGRGR